MLKRKNETMESNKIIEILSKKVTHRVDLYSAAEKIDKYYKDLGLQSNEISLSTNEGGGVGASIFNVISIKAEKGIASTEKIVLDYRDKGKIIEEVSREDVQNNDEGNKNGLFLYRGEGCFTIWNSEFGLLNPDENSLVQQEREIQEEIMETPTAIFSFNKGKTNYISIANKGNFDLGMFASYRTANPFGILGLIERKLSENIILINPFWIWKE